MVGQRGVGGRREGYVDGKGFGERVVSDSPIEEIAAGIGALMRDRRGVGAEASDRLLLAARIAALGADAESVRIGEGRVLSSRPIRRAAEHIDQACRDVLA